MLSKANLHASIAAQSPMRILGVVARQQFSTQSNVKEAKTATEVSLENACPYSKVPVPTYYQFFRGFLPGGAYYKKSAIDMIMYLSKKHGLLIRMPTVYPNPEMCFTINPDNFATVFRNEGQWPVRLSFASAVYFREVYRADIFQGVEGILTTSGEKWAKARSAINPILLNPKNARLYLNSMLEVNDDFLERIREIRDPLTNEMPEDFEEDINHVALEMITAVALNKRMGFINKNRHSAEAKTLIKSLRRFFDLGVELDLLPSIWKIIKTPKFYEMMNTLDTLTNICIKYINEAIARIEHDTEGKLTSQVGKEKSVLEKLLRIDKKIAVSVALDMLMAGVDTTSSTLVGILLCIAKNPDKQQKLYEEMKQIMPQKDSPLTIENMSHLPYLRACIKEGIRRYPILPGTGRCMPHDIELSGYRIPKGVHVQVGSNLCALDEKYVKHALDFLPERWLRPAAGQEQPEGHITNPFLYIPFGFGPRSCAGKRIVNIELEIMVGRLVRNFEIGFNYPVENAFKSKLINVPNIPLKFKFEERKE